MCKYGCFNEMCIWLLVKCVYGGLYVFIPNLLNFLVQSIIAPLIYNLFVKVFMTLLSIKPNPTQPNDKFFVIDLIDAVLSAMLAYD